MNPVVHFEMQADDQARITKFYTEVFGWKTQQLGPEMNSYVVATTTESDAHGRPTTPGAINGGFYKREEGDKLPGSIVIAVDDIKEHMQKVTDAGGRVLGEPWDIPGVGLYVSILDTEGNRLSILQPKK